MDAHTPADDEAERVRQLVAARFGSRVRDVRVLARDGGLVLRGRVSSYHLKQLVQEAVLGATVLGLAANEIVVDGSRPGGAAPHPLTHTNAETDMPQLRSLTEKFLADGKIDGREVEALGDLLPPDRGVSRAEADFLVELHKRVERVTPKFEAFFYHAIKRHVLADGAIDAGEVAWLRRMILADGRVDEREKKLLRELKGEAARTCPEFEALFAECVK